jgi:hypothetical protein
MPPQVHIFGIRHHGPGCARSLQRALDAFAPDCLLIEGPPDVSADLLALAAAEKMKPPVALLVYAADEARRAAFYPFATFSPEWQAIQYALAHKAHLRFMDLPMLHRFALEKAEEERFAEELKARLAAAGGGPAQNPQEAEEPPEESPDPPDPSANPSAGPAPAPENPEPDDPYIDPLAHLAKAAGYADAETWWDHMIESRAGAPDNDQADAELFAAILEAMTALREALPARPDTGRGRFEEKRESWMRQTIRAALKEGYEKIAVVCGAWHAPALLPDRMPPAKRDDETLAKLPKLKTAAAWVPWTYGRLSMASGYGAGIASPGYYHHLWQHTQPRPTPKPHAPRLKPRPSPLQTQDSPLKTQDSPDPPLKPHDSSHPIAWLTKVAQLLRSEDLDASSAHIIETVRLAESLAAMRDRPLPSLVELTEATRTVLLFGDSAQLALIHNKLIVGERLGEVPAEGAVAPLQLDLQKQQKRLRLMPEASDKNLELDLRKPNDLERSELLHRLRLLAIPWGKPLEAAGRSKGTFKEPWKLAWEPEFAVRLIEASPLGNTLYDAASAHARRTAASATDLPLVTDLLDHTLQASLPEAVAFVLKRVDALAAITADLLHMMQAVPPLANVVRYGNVRQTDTALVAHVVRSLLARIMVGLGPACASLNDDAAADMEQTLSRAHAAVQLLYPSPPSPSAPPAYADPSIDRPLPQWLDTLARLADQSGLHGLVAGRITRLLLDVGHFTSDDAAQRMALALSVGNDPAQAAAWIQGFLKGSGLILLHDESLWRVLDEWVAAMPEEGFTSVLPLLRRSFSQFPAPERSQMGQRVKRATAGGAASATRPPDTLDPTRAARVLDVLKLLLTS